MNARSRNWSFTINNYTDEILENLKEISMVSTYLIYGKEVAPTTLTKHLQGFIYFQDAKSFAKIKKLLPEGAHIEISKGTAQQNKIYCSKENNITEYGVIPEQGKRNDIKLIKDEIVSGKGMRDIIEIASNYQTLRTAELLLKYVETKRNWKPEVIWVYGASGTGKTRMVYEKMPNLYRKTNSTGKWWDGYDAHEDILIDDVKDSSKEMYIFLLEILDRYDCRVECKGGTRQILAKRIMITSIKSPEELYYHLDPEIKELKRRIDDIICLYPTHI